MPRPARHGRPLLLATLIALLVCAAPAAAAPVADFDFAPAAPLPNQAVTFTSTSRPSDGPGNPPGHEIAAIAWDFLDDGTVEDTDGSATFAFPAPGDYPVRLTVVDHAGQYASRVRTVTVVNNAPSVSFGFFPFDPYVGQTVGFMSSASDPDGQPLTYAWDLAGVGASTPHASRSFPASDLYVVRLTVTDPFGASATASQVVPVRATPTSPPLRDDDGTPTRDPDPPQPSRPSDPSAPRLISPFPLVRLASELTGPGVKVRVLSVRAPKGAVVTIRCKGRSCPFKRVRKLSKGKRVRFPRIERRLPPGTVLEILVRRSERIGKYTRFRIVKGAAPRRLDRCLWPGATRGRTCPAD